MKVQNIDTEQNLDNSKQLQKNLKDLNLDEESHISISAVSEDTKLLESCENKSIFLSKVCMLLVIYFGFAHLILLYIWNYPEDARDTYIHQRLAEAYKFHLTISIVLKLIFSILDFALKKLSLVFYLLDFYFTYLWVLGIYFTLDGYGGTDKTRDEFQLMIIVMFYVSIAFFFSSLYRTKKKKYSIMTGLIFTQLTVVLCLYVAEYQSKMDLLQSSKVKIFISFVFINLYITINALLLVNVRSIELKESEYILAYFQFYGDWINSFWVDLILSKKQLRIKKLQAMKVENSKQRQSLRRKTLIKLNEAIEQKKNKKQRKLKKNKKK